VAKLLLLDGNSLTYRAFFALPADMATASGQVTNAVFGFTSMLINLLRDHRPDAIAVAWDRPEPTFRHEALDTYKANREAAPDILRQQLGLVRQVLEALDIVMLEKPGVEADDIIATLASEARDPLRRGGHQGAHRRHPRAVSRVRGDARRHVGQPARCSRRR
jgi:DNA polymerase-1